MMRYRGYDAPVDAKRRRQGCGGLAVALVAIFIYGVAPALLPFQYFALFETLFGGADAQAGGSAYQTGELLFSIAVLLLYFWIGIELVDRYKRVTVALFLLPFTLSLAVFYVVLSVTCNAGLLRPCSSGSSLPPAALFELYRFYLVVLFASAAAYLKRWSDARRWSA